MRNVKTAGAGIRTGIRRLPEDDLDRVSGGFKWDRNYVSPNVIDARGGQVTVLGITFTLDVNGKISSVS